ncbi:hypothetical protein ACH4PU_14255 [Streptomyces sp. NPDC021100]|uniref:hypothetical protein n=1 Tax=Streptomyces sp. NPDC021100 TaxID=3365114 RepID=UPI0037984169
MRSARRITGTLLLVTALTGGLAACGPEDDKASDGSGGPAASVKPSARPANAGDAGPGTDDCGGKPPVMPAGHTMIEVKLERDASGFEAQTAKPKCTPNDWIHHGEGEAKHYALAPDVKPRLALSAGPGQYSRSARTSRPCTSTAARPMTTAA